MSLMRGFFIALLDGCKSMEVYQQDGNPESSMRNFRGSRLFDRLSCAANRRTQCFSSVKPMPPRLMLPLPQKRSESHLCDRSESHLYRWCDSDLFWGSERAILWAVGLRLVGVWAEGTGRGRLPRDWDSFPLVVGVARKKASEFSLKPFCGWDTRARTRNNRTRICCVANYTISQFLSAKS